MLLHVFAILLITLSSLFSQPTNCDAFLVVPTKTRWTGAKNHFIHYASTFNSFQSSIINVTTNENQCDICSETFASRNALFRHVRSSHDKTQKEELIRHTVAFEITYYSTSESMDYISRPSEAKIAGQKLQEAVTQSLNDMNRENSLLSLTQSSVANQRHKVLSQEPGVPSASDVVVISYSAPQGANQINKLRLLLEKVNANLNPKEHDNDHTHVQILACKPIPSTSRLLQAERDCTQRSYHYLLPLSWLPEGDKLETWWLQENENIGHQQIGTQSSACLQHLQSKFKSPPPSNSLKLLSKVLRSAESISLPNRKVRRKPLNNENVKGDGAVDKRFQEADRSPESLRVAKGRYGLLANKKRRAWHNFAAPSLRGDASPNQEPVWRVVDRLRISGFMSHRCSGGGKNQAVAIIEIKGDDFVQDQIRRIIGTALAITHGWLPRSFFYFATDPYHVIETPKAPAGRLYAHAPRFHFFEKRTGKCMFQDENVIRSDIEHNRNSVAALQKILLERRSTDLRIQEERAWLADLEHNIAPRVRLKIQAEADAQLSSATDTPSGGLPESFIAPELYQRTLGLLRDIVDSESWPDTSKARSNVIRKNDRMVANTEGKAGSFTVFNPKIDAICRSQERLPLGNTLFPNLVEAVFELEDILSQDILSRAAIDGSVESSGPRNYKRPLSSCCAINCNAQFTPHVDSGKGAGQSLSMIVGLGDYSQGDIYVEGIPHDIRYKALEFDGWSSRHWTNWYNGERFSLVWFSPELKEDSS